jgi:hypothetical protein
MLRLLLHYCLNRKTCRSLNTGSKKIRLMIIEPGPHVVGFAVLPMANLVARIMHEMRGMRHFPMSVAVRGRQRWVGIMRILRRNGQIDDDRQKSSQGKTNNGRFHGAIPFAISLAVLKKQMGILHEDNATGEKVPPVRFDAIF